MLLTHFIWQTDLKPLSGTNAKNGAIPLSLTPTMHIIHARCYKASEWVARQDSDGGRGTEKMCTLHAVFVLWICLRETWTVFKTILNTRG